MNLLSFAFFVLTGVALATIVWSFIFKRKLSDWWQQILILFSLCKGNVSAIPTMFTPSVKSEDDRTNDRCDILFPSSQVPSTTRRVSQINECMPHFWCPHCSWKCTFLGMIALLASMGDVRRYLKTIKGGERSSITHADILMLTTVVIVVVVVGSTVTPPHHHHHLVIFIRSFGYQ